MSLLRRILGKKRQRLEVAPAKPGRPCPNQPLFVVGDLHGQSDLFEQMLEKIDAVIGAEQLPDPILCFTGNLIDHGDGSEALLRRMQELTQEFPRNVVCLMGNHEQMCLEFLNAPQARHARWLREGGAVTCRSFGIDLVGEEISPDQAIALADALTEAMTPPLIDWITSRPTSLRSGNVTVAHAGADPARQMDDQSDRVLIWGHPEFLSRARVDNEWVAHGHHVVKRASETEGRISVNTEAWRSGVLSAAYVSPPGEVRFLTVERS